MDANQLQEVLDWLNAQNWTVAEQASDGGSWILSDEEIVGTYLFQEGN